ncbi:MAG: hypothetical protein QOE77_2437 [Blastocatellia bacterium]|jgi:hypothetical protein|nr:hypothetical protein [Blastocatellia bacterium]
MVFANPLTARIVAFLQEIGIEVVPASFAEETFLPGILVDKGRLLVEEAKILYPGDLLHEAGHLAVAPPEIRASLSGEVNIQDEDMDPIEAQAICWSYAALTHLGLAPEVVFHEGGYRKHAQDLILNFRLGVYLGANGLEELGMTVTARAARERGLLPYPHMLKWLRD